MEINSAADRASRTDSPLLAEDVREEEKVGERRTSLYFRTSFSASLETKYQACSGVHFLSFPSSDDAVVSKYIFRISEADCSIISVTARLGDCPVLSLRARNSRSVNLPPRTSIHPSNSRRSSLLCEGVSAFSSEPSFSFLVEVSESRWVMTKRFATSGEISPRAICRKTRSGRALLKDFEYEMSFVRKMTCAIFVVVREAAHSASLS